MTIETVELVCKRVHMPYPNVRIPANMRIAIGPPELADALVARGYFERIAPDIIKQEAAPPAAIKEQSKPPDNEQAVKGGKKGK